MNCRYRLEKCKTAIGEVGNQWLMETRHVCPSKNIKGCVLLFQCVKTNLFSATGRHVRNYKGMCLSERTNVPLTHLARGWFAGTCCDIAFNLGITCSFIYFYKNMTFPTGKCGNELLRFM